MTTQELQHRERFVTQMLAETQAPAAEHLARLLLRHGKTYSRLQEAHCNGVGEWCGESNESFSRRQARFEKWIDKREGQIERRIARIAQALGYVADFQGDPRGYTVRIVVPSRSIEDAIGVPTS